ncbi:MAG: DNA replication/repair protein RecF [Armatimonadota bacterium]|nr:DNA replication/repair protein RecF [Armatimonadota bacterium]
MHITQLSLRSFRNYETLDLVPQENLNLLIGSNAQGKSAILEAVYFLSTSKSHRTTRDAELIRLGSEHARVSAEIHREARPDVMLEIVLSRTQRRILRVDRKKKERLVDFIGQLNAIIFSSFDVEMVRGEPALRRRFLDLELSQTSPQYLYALARYKRTLEQRNRALKLINAGRAQPKILEPLDEQLAFYGSIVTARRSEFVADLGSAAEEVYRRLTAGNEILDVVYNPSARLLNGKAEDIKSVLVEQLAEKRDIDIARGSTTIGPHRDDVEMRVDGVPVREYASQGQQRCAALALKLAEAAILREKLGEAPVILLDDVCAELDIRRRSGALAFIREGFQAFVTATALEELPGEMIRGAQVFDVEGGEVRKR